MLPANSALGSAEEAEARYGAAGEPGSMKGKTLLRYDGPPATNLLVENRQPATEGNEVQWQRSLILVFAKERSRADEGEA